MIDLSPIKIIINPRAGTDNRTELAAQITQNFLLENNLEFNAEETLFRGDAIQIAKNAVKEKFKTILVIGGDGTVNEAVNGIAESRTLLGIIPTGTGNDFAVALGLKEYKTKEDCQALLTGKIKEVDLGKINNRYFANGVGFGLDAEIAARISKIKYEQKTKKVYLKEVLKAFLTYQPKEIKLIINNEIQINTKIISVAIGNGVQFGRGFMLTPDAKLDDGLLDICIIKNMPKPLMFWHLPKVFKGKHTSIKWTSMLKANSIKVDSPDLLIAHADGEIIDQAPYTISLAKEKLNILTP